MDARGDEADQFVEASDVVVYDIMRERLTRLGGSMVALIDLAEEAGDTARVDAAFEQMDVYRRQVDAVDPHDRAAQIRMIAYLASERDRIEAMLPPP